MYKYSISHCVLNNQAIIIVFLKCALFSMGTAPLPATQGHQPTRQLAVEKARGTVPFWQNMFILIKQVLRQQGQLEVGDISGRQEDTDQQCLLAWGGIARRATRKPVKLVEPVVGMGSCPGYQLWGCTGPRVWPSPITAADLHFQNRRSENYSGPIHGTQTGATVDGG